jgi:hypothetical protein
VKVVVYPADRFGCGSFRMRWPGEACAQAGHDVTVVAQDRRTVRLVMEGDTVRDVLVDADVVVLQRVTHAYMAQAVGVMRAKGITVVVDVDDDLSSIHPSNPAWKMHHPSNEGRRLVGGQVNRHSWRNLALACRDATLVTVSTPALLDVYARHGRGHVLPNYLPEHYYGLPRQDSDVIGWPGSFHSHPNDPEAVGGAVARLVEEGASFVMRGDSSGAGKAFGLSADPAGGAVPIEEWPRAVASLGIGIAPLADTRFNAAKCVDSSMRICTHRGVVEAGEIEPGDRVWRDGWKAVEAVEHDVPRPGVEITTEGGYKLRLTPEHRMLVNGEWTQAKDISIGDTMAMDPEPVGPTTPVCAPWPADSRMSRRGGPFDPRAFLTAPDGPRVELTPRWGRFLGAFVGDGNLGGSSTQIQISCDGQDQDWIDTLMEDFRAFGFNPTTEVKTMFDGTVLRRRGVRVASAHLIRVLDSWGLTKERPDGRPIRKVCVPEVIWRSPREVIAEFLAAYFEADGCTTSSGVSAVSKDEQLIRDVQRLLLLFGIVSRVGPRIHRAQNNFSGEYWHLTMGRAGADVFAKEIGFRSARKRARLAAITDRPHSNAYRPMNWAPKVTEVKPCMVTPVDIQVEGSEYIAAGFVSHNSFLKPMEMSACGVPWVASPRAEYQRIHKMGAGILADRPRAWYRELKRLHGSAALRHELSLAGRAVAEQLRLRDHSWRWQEAWARAYEIQQTTPRSAVAV